MDRFMPTIGCLIVIGSVIGGYTWHGGNLALLWQPSELLIIGGSGLGAFVIMNDWHNFKEALHASFKGFFHSSTSKVEYLDTLLLMNDILKKIKKVGAIKLEADMDKPEDSEIFKKYPRVLKKKIPVLFLCDSFRLLISGQSIPSHELEPLMDNEIDFFHEEEVKSAHCVYTLAESFPALGIVAAVLGVILTMTKIAEPPEILGASIGAALVGTFLGVLLSYGFVGPLAKKIELLADKEKEMMYVIKTIIMCYVMKMAPQMAVEFGRRAIPTSVRPNFFELEEMLKKEKIVIK
jgi:chemotaxis protein MotA